MPYETIRIAPGAQIDPDFLARLQQEANIDWSQEFKRTREAAIADNGVEQPSIFKKTANYISAKARHIANGSPLCTDEQVQERFKVCIDCPSGMFVSLSPNSGKCKKCGCGLMGVVAERGDSKLRWADSACPLKHWLRLDEPNA